MRSYLPSILILLIGTSLSFATIAYEYVDVDARNVAMGGATVATVTDLFAMEINPALLAKSQVPSFSISGNVVERGLWDFFYNSGIKETMGYLQEGGAIFPIELIGRRITFAAGFRQQMISERSFNYYDTNSDIPWTISGGIGIELLNWLDLGASVHYWGGKVETYIARRVDWGYTSRLGEVEYSGFDTQIGLVADLAELGDELPLKIGLSVSPTFELKQTSVKTIKPEGWNSAHNDPGLYFAESTTSNMIPLRVDLGIAVQLPRQILVEFDVTHVNLGDTKWENLQDPRHRNPVSDLGDDILRTAVGVEKIIIASEIDFAIRVGFFTQNTGRADIHNFYNPGDYSADQDYGSAVRKSGYSFGAGLYGNRMRLDLAYSSASSETSYFYTDEHFTFEQSGGIFTCSLTWYLKNRNGGGE